VTTEGPLTWWTGWDARGGAAADPGGVTEFARSAPPGPGPRAHYDLLAVAARGFRPPKFLTTVEQAGKTAVGSDGEEIGDLPGLRPTWNLLYRRIAETGPVVTVPYGIYLLGVNPPPDLTDEELAVFNDFYTNVHLVEVAERRHALRAVRYELVREVRPPYQGAPRFLAVYEVDAESAANRRHTGPKYSAGPEVWQRHKTPWRLWYRRLPADGDLSAG
jgi:hypothetical protein